METQLVHQRTCTYCHCIIKFYVVTAITPYCIATAITPYCIATAITPSIEMSKCQTIMLNLKFDRL